LPQGVHGHAVECFVDGRHERDDLDAVGLKQRVRRSNFACNGSCAAVELPPEVQGDG
jgi:hypothetical protein